MPAPSRPPMTSDSLLLLVLLFAAAAAGWFSARLTQARRVAREQPRLSAEYFQGLNFILDEQTDKALEVFLRMADLDRDALETHFALGSLFRRRGEVERAIRIHQGLAEREELPGKDRDRALRALADDYVKAGLFDRAEELLERLAGTQEYAADALRRLVRIYEQERDWEKAIAARDRLAASSGEGHSPVVAHYYCELATEARSRGDLHATRQYLRHARAADRDSIRGALLRADLAMEQGDYPLAVRLLRAVLRRDGAFAPQVLPALRRCYAALEDRPGFERLLEGLVKERPELKPGVAYAAIVDEGFDDEVTAACIREFVAGNPLLTDLMEILRTPRGAEEDDAVERITRALRRLSGRSPGYLCENCGFSPTTLFWQCPTCKSWDTIRPVARFRFEAALHPDRG